MRILYFLEIVSFLFLTMSMAFAHQHPHAHLGEIHFETSGHPKAQAYFIEGVKWLHSFEYNEARSAFLCAQQLDPSFALAYWGEAMTYNHPLWSEQDRGAALRALRKLAPTAKEQIAQAKTPKEKGLLRAIQILYGPGDKKARDIAYAESMRVLYRQFPKDDEIASFYALALLGAAGGERDVTRFMQAAGIVEEIYGRNPCHPGAIHYAIHSYDDPTHASLGLRAARAYASMAPDASHALHMPSHIFLALGMWEDVIASNKAAWEAGYQPHKQASDYTLDDLHAVHWLSYGYLQTKQYEAAHRLIKVVEGIAAKTQSPMAVWFYTLMRAAYINEKQDWATDLSSITLPHLELSARATDLYIKAVIALNQAKPNWMQINRLAQELKNLIPDKPVKKDTHQDYFTAVLPSGITATKIMSLELNAQIKWRQGYHEEALSLLKQAAQLEGGMSFGYGPPLPVQPAYELLAYYLLAAKKYQAAYENYLVAIKRAPKRRYAAEGLKRAQVMLLESGISVPEKIYPYFNKLMLPNHN